MQGKRHTRVAAGALAALALCTIASAPTAAADSKRPSARPDLTPQDGSTNVREAGSAVELGRAEPTATAADVDDRLGYAMLRPVTLDAAASAVTVTYDASTPKGSNAAVDVRTRRANGAWTQWTPAEDGEPTALEAASRKVQLRVAFAASPDAGTPSVSDVEVTRASRAAKAQDAERAAAPVTSRVYATREGLVGGTTANGHVIVERDHFVALPSRRGLAPKGSGEYSVQACANSRCVWEPVWDVGPWNTRDDYWNPPDVREMWKDLPQGNPEAQAAYQDGYNGGKDEFGRAVANPAGIDLADGAFWDGLQMSDNGWVDVVYQWTGTGTYGTVAVGGGYLNVRNGASTGSSVVGMAGDTAKVPLQCQVTGDTIEGSQGTTNVWYRVNGGMYVSKAWVAGGNVAAC